MKTNIKQKLSIKIQETYGLEKKQCTEQSNWGFTLADAEVVWNE